MVELSYFIKHLFGQTEVVLGYNDRDILRLVLTFSF